MTLLNGQALKGTSGEGSEEVDEEGAVEALPGTHTPSQEPNDEEMQAVSDDEMEQEQPSASYVPDQVAPPPWQPHSSPAASHRIGWAFLLENLPKSCGSTQNSAELHVRGRLTRYIWRMSLCLS